MQFFSVRRLHNHSIQQAKLSALGANYLAAIEVDKVRLQWIVLKICYWPAFPPCRTPILSFMQKYLCNVRQRGPRGRLQMDAIPRLLEIADDKAV